MRFCWRLFRQPIVIRRWRITSKHLRQAELEFRQPGSYAYENNQFFSYTQCFLEIVKPVAEDH